VQLTLKGNRKMATASKKTSRKTAPAVAVAEVGTVTMEQIVEATLDQSKGFVYTGPAIHTPLIEAGLVEVNLTMSNEAGEFATRATEKGIATVSKNDTQETAAVAAVETAPAAKSGFAIEANIPVPAIYGRGRTGTTYPFDKMDVGQSFFVANDESRPNAAKSMASTVSSATARYAEVVPGEFKTNRKGEQVPVTRETRKFIVRSVEENGVKGARVWRTA
jgi:hypothetical protein